MTQQITDTMLAEAKQLWSYMPFRQCWIALKSGERFRVICESTARRANMLVQEGWTVYKLRQD